MSRRSCRDSLFKLVYQYMFNKELVAHEALDAFAEDMDIEEQKYVLDNYSKLLDNYEDITASIASATKGFEVKRLYKVDLAILLVAIFEVRVLGEPIPVVVNEAVELAKKYSNEKSPSFINGILSQILNK